jgi:hypothetical protein
MPKKKKEKWAATKCVAMNAALGANWIGFFFTVYMPIT